MKSRPAAVLCPIQKRPVIIIMVREAVRKGRFLHRISLWNLTKCRCPWRLKINLDSQCGCSSCSQSKINHIMEIICVPIHSACDVVPRNHGGLLNFVQEKHNNLLDHTSVMRVCITFENPASIQRINWLDCITVNDAWLIPLCKANQWKRAGPL